MLLFLPFFILLHPGSSPDFILLHLGPLPDFILLHLGSSPCFILLHPGSLSGFILLHILHSSCHTLYLPPFCFILLHLTPCHILQQLGSSQTHNLVDPPRLHPSSMLSPLLIAFPFLSFPFPLLVSYNLWECLSFATRVANLLSELWVSCLTSGLLLLSGRCFQVGRPSWPSPI